MAYRVKDDSYQLADLQTKMLSLLECFITFCKENGLRYYACGGTLIGALRHKGFIPWDDDLDVFMPREDYEKLWELRETVRSNTKGIVLARTTKEKNYHHRVMRLIDCNTTFINSRSVDEDIEHGVYIDILPMDVCAPKGLKRIGQVLDAVLYSVFNIQCLPEYHGGPMYRMAVGLLLFLVRNPKLRYRIWKNCEGRMTRFSAEESNQVVELSASLKVLLHPYPAEWFCKTVECPFENLQIQIPVGAEQYLNQVFGDYRQLPPMNERHPRHHTVRIDLEHGYEQYRGKDYLVGRKMQTDK